MARLRSRIRAWTFFLIAGLVISGATALPIPAQVRFGVRILGPDLRGGGAVPEDAARWLRTLRDGIEATETADAEGGAA